MAADSSQRKEIISQNKKKRERKESFPGLYEGERASKGPGWTDKQQNQVKFEA